MVKVFVYGTLKWGFHNHSRFLGDAELIGEGILKDYSIHPLSYGFPAILENEGYIVRGELYEVKESDIPKLDMLEGFRGKDRKDNMYNREKVNIRVKNKMYSAYVYVWNGDVMYPPMDEGIWSGETCR